MDIEAMAQAMFDALHERFNRARDWARHRDQDVGPEFGRETFRHMARAAAAVPPPVVEDAPSAASVEGEAMEHAPEIAPASNVEEMH